MFSETFICYLCHLQNLIPPLFLKSYFEITRVRNRQIKADVENGRFDQIPKKKLFTMLTNGLHRHTIVIRISTLLLRSKSDMFTNSCFYQNLLIYFYRSKSLQARWDFEPVSAALYDQAVVVAKLVMRRFTNSRGLRFKSSHGQKFILSVYFQPY